MIKKTRIGRFTQTLSLAIGAVAIAAALATNPAAALQLGAGMSSIDMGHVPMAVSGLQSRAYNPSMSLSSSATTPLQQQMQDDYATSLMNAQRQMLQQNPLDDGPTEREIGSQLNGYMGPR